MDNFTTKGNKKYKGINPSEGEISQNFCINEDDYRIEDYSEAAGQGDVELQYKLAMCYFNGKQKDYTEAIKWFKKVLTSRKKQHGEKSIDVVEIYYFIAECYKKLAEFEKAVYYYKKTLSIYKKEYEEDHFLITDTLSDIEICNKHINKRENVK